MQLYRPSITSLHDLFRQLRQELTHWLLRAFWPFGPVENTAAAQQRYAAWREETQLRLINELFPGAPWQLDATVSFLQGQPFDPGEALRLDLFFHDQPLLAIDLLGPAHRSDYRLARGWLCQEAWAREQRRLAEKRARLARHHCPYLVLWDTDPNDLASLRERVAPHLPGAVLT